jgi:predicted GTPase
MKNIQAFNPEATIVSATSQITVPEGEQIQGKTVLVVEDGPALTQGEMAFGAGIVAAEKYGASRRHSQSTPIWTRWNVIC